MGEKLKNRMEREVLIEKTKLRNWKNLYGDMKVSNYNGVNFLYGKIQKLREECEQLKYNNPHTENNVRERQEWKYKVTILEKKNKEMENNIRREREEKIRKKERKKERERERERERETERERGREGDPC